MLPRSSVIISCGTLKCRVTIPIFIYVFVVFFALWCDQSEAVVSLFYFIMVFFIYLGLEKCEGVIVNRNLIEEKIFGIDERFI